MREIGKDSAAAITPAEKFYSALNKMRPRKWEGLGFARPRYLISSGKII
jgi:hypothetical protein